MVRLMSATLLAIAAVAIGAPAQAGATLTSANVFAGATAVVITGNKFDPKEKDDSATLADGRKTVDAAVSVVNEDAKGDRAFDQEDVFANFSSQTSGTVDFAGSSSSLAFTPNKIAEAYNSGSSFNYDFVLTSSYNFAVSYFLSETDNFFSDNYFQLIDLAGGPPLISGSPDDGAFAAPTTGGASILLTPGSYEFGVTTRLGDVSAVQGPGFGSGSHLDQYSFDLSPAVSAAPEPLTWLFMLIGIAGMGLVFRQTEAVRHGALGGVPNSRIRQRFS